MPGNQVSVKNRNVHFHILILLVDFLSRACVSSLLEKGHTLDIHGHKENTHLCKDICCGSKKLWSALFSEDKICCRLLKGENSTNFVTSGAPYSTVMHVLYFV